MRIITGLAASWDKHDPCPDANDGLGHDPHRYARGFSARTRRMMAGGFKVPVVWRHGSPDGDFRGIDFRNFDFEAVAFGHVHDLVETNAGLEMTASVDLPAHVLEEITRMGGTFGLSPGYYCKSTWSTWDDAQDCPVVNDCIIREISMTPAGADRNAVGRVLESMKLAAPRLQPVNPDNHVAPPGICRECADGFGRLVAAAHDRTPMAQWYCQHQFTYACAELEWRRVRKWQLTSVVSPEDARNIRTAWHRQIPGIVSNVEVIR